MKFARRDFVRLVAGVAALLVMSPIARAQTYPTRPITTIVPFPAGGTTDVLARILVERMRRVLGQPIIIENVGGADGSIGTAHAGGEVHGGAAVGDLDFAPGPMRVEKDEHIGGAVALVLAVVALDLPWLGRNRLAHLADELGRALIEADDRAFRIGRFGVEIKHILHAGDIFGIHLRNAPHVLAPRLEVVFSQPAGARYRVRCRRVR
jgi:hypothetical protein